jgi:hypothetical protein
LQDKELLDHEDYAADEAIWIQSIAKAMADGFTA